MTYRIMTMTVMTCQNQQHALRSNTGSWLNGSHSNRSSFCGSWISCTRRDQNAHACSTMSLRCSQTPDNVWPTKASALLRPNQFSNLLSQLKHLKFSHFILVNCFWNKYCFMIFMCVTVNHSRTVFCFHLLNNQSHMGHDFEF